MAKSDNLPIRTESILISACLFAGLFAAAARADDREDCLFCHRFPGLSRLDPDAGTVRLFYVDPTYVEHTRGPHARLACTDCHVAEQVGVVPHYPVTPVDCTRTCHLADPAGLERRFSHADAALQLAQSVHKPETLQKLSFTGGPLLAPGQSECLYCHDEPVFRNPDAARGLFAGIDPERTFDRCDSCHTAQLPTDTRYYAQHIAARLQPARPTLEMAQVCAVCHSDPLIQAEHDLPNSVASYMRSFHGKAALLGDQSTADCLGCHVLRGENAHLMLGPESPQSSVHADNIANACRSRNCHPGADVALAASASHLELLRPEAALEFALAFAFIVLTAVSFLPSMAIVVLELAQIVIGRRREHAHDLHNAVRTLQATEIGRRRLERFTVPQRIQHWLLVLFFTLLALTGFPMKFADQAWSKAVIDVFGGLAVARQVHHWAGIALVAGVIVHGLSAAVTLLRHAASPAPDGGRVGLWRAFWALPMVVSPAEAAKTLALFAHLLGLRRERPTFGRFSATEKFEYFGVMWGTVLLGLTGLMLWGEQIVSHVFGGRVFNLASIIHTYEAFLALIHVGVLHIYNVVFNPAVFPISGATFSGATPADKLVEENGEFVREAALAAGLEAQSASEGPHV